MFLDDKLIELCKMAVVDTPEDVQQLNTDVCRLCEKYYKDIIRPKRNITDDELKVILNRTFNLFDSFVRQALDSDVEKLRILGVVFEKHTFKQQFLSNKEINKIYNKL